MSDSGAGQDVPPATPPGHTLGDAARLLGISIQTVRRRLDDKADGLMRVKSASKRRSTFVTYESLRTARRELALKLDMYLEPPTKCDHPDLSALQTVVDDLRIENERLRRLVQTLRINHQQLLDNVGDFADPALPNN